MHTCAIGKNKISIHFLHIQYKAPAYSFPLHLLSNGHKVRENGSTAALESFGALEVLKNSSPNLF